MTNAQNVTIVLLLATAGILGALLVGTYVGTSERALGDTPDRGGDYILITGEWSGTLDLVYVIDIAKDRMVAYWVNQNTGAVEIVDTMDLRSVFRAE